MTRQGAGAALHACTKEPDDLPEEEIKKKSPERLLQLALFFASYESGNAKVLTVIQPKDGGPLQKAVQGAGFSSTDFPTFYYNFHF